MRCWSYETEVSSDALRYTQGENRESIRVFADVGFPLSTFQISGKKEKWKLEIQIWKDTFPDKAWNSENSGISQHTSINSRIYLGEYLYIMYILLLKCALCYILRINNEFSEFFSDDWKKWKMINHYRLGPLRRNVRDYSVHQRSTGKTAGDRLRESELSMVKSCTVSRIHICSPVARFCNH